jgi:hypothetical protein
VLAEIQEHVDQSQPHLARRSERVSVIALGPDRAVTCETAVDGAGATDAEARQAAREIVAGVGLDDEVQVVRLNRKVNEAEATTAGRGQSAA